MKSDFTGDMVRGRNNLIYYDYKRAHKNNYRGTIITKRNINHTSQRYHQKHPVLAFSADL